MKMKEVTLGSGGSYSNMLTLKAFITNVNIPRHGVVDREVRVVCERDVITGKVNVKLNREQTGGAVTLHAVPGLKEACLAKAHEVWNGWRAENLKNEDALSFEFGTHDRLLANVAGMTMDGHVLSGSIVYKLDAAGCPSRDLTAGQTLFVLSGAESGEVKFRVANKERDMLAKLLWTKAEEFAKSHDAQRKLKRAETLRFELASVKEQLHHAEWEVEHYTKQFTEKADELFRITGERTSRD
jgi:hypothetical protein